MSISLYISDIGEILPDDFHLVSPERAKKAERYKMPDDRRRCIAGGILTDRFVGGEITENGFGKPISSNGVRFNLSHSGSYVLLAVSDSEVGCDIERVRDVDPLKLGRVVFCVRELELIERASDKTAAFFTLWTKKEALLKCMGKGFHRPAKSVDVSGESFCEDSKIYRFQTLRLSDYVISVCSEAYQPACEPEPIKLK